MKKFNIYGQEFGIKEGFVQITPEQLEDMLDVMAFDHAQKRNDELLPMDVAKRLMTENPVKVYREYRDLTQGQLASAAGLAQSTVAEIESGKKTGSLNALLAIASALGVEITDIITDDPKPSGPKIRREKTEVANGSARAGTYVERRTRDRSVKAVA